MIKFLTSLIFTGPTDLISEGLAEDDLRRHPVGRPDEGVAPLVHLAVLGRHAEVSQLHLPVLRQEDVACKCRELLVQFHHACKFG